MFKFELGLEVESKVSKIRGIITARSENLYGCNRYYILFPMSKDLKVEGWWVDEDDITVKGKGVKAAKKATGGMIARDR